MHRSTLVRKLREMHIDIRALRNAERSPPHGVRTHQQNRNVGLRLWKRISRSFVSGLPQNLKEEICRGRESCSFVAGIQYSSEVSGCFTTTRCSSAFLNRSKSGCCCFGSQTCTPNSAVQNTTFPCS